MAHACAHDAETGAAELSARPSYAEISEDCLDAHDRGIPVMSASGRTVIVKSPLAKVAISAVAGLAFLGTMAWSAVSRHHHLAHRPQGPRLEVSLETREESGWHLKCPGKIGVAGYGAVSLVNAQFTNVYPTNGTAIVPTMGGRTYFADSCADGPYSPDNYLAVNLMQKTMRWTIDLNGAGCGCNAAFYLVSMRQNPKIGTCSDYYCDANKVCGVPCTEIDLMEANTHAWFTTLHLADGTGHGVGYGGSYAEPMRRDWTHKEYGPNASCIDTLKPFEVAISFPGDEHGLVGALEVTLRQEGKPCPLSARVDKYPKDPHAMKQFTRALQDGMTPVLSFWSSKDMTWMDGPGADGEGPCTPPDKPDECPDTVKFSDFRINDFEGFPAPPSKDDMVKVVA